MANTLIHFRLVLLSLRLCIASLDNVTLVYLVTELAEGGELFDRICRKGNYYEHDAAHLVYTICSAVAYLHEEGIVHRGKLFAFKEAWEKNRLRESDTKVFVEQ